MFVCELISNSVLPVFFLAFFITEAQQHIVLLLQLENKNTHKVSLSVRAVFTTVASITERRTLRWCPLSIPCHLPPL